MKTIILIQCSGKKMPHMAKAKDLYIGPLKNTILFAKRNFPNAEILILSALHGLVDPETEIDPYNVSCKELSKTEQKAWASRVTSQLSQKSSLVEDQFIILAGVCYREYLLPSLRNYIIPMEGLRIRRTTTLFGYSLMNNYCPLIHEYFNNLPRWKFPFFRGRYYS